MKKKNVFPQRLFLALGALALTAGAFALGRRRPPAAPAEPAAQVPRPPMLEPPHDPPPAQPRPKPFARPLVAAAFTVLFFAGAAFTAGAGDQLAHVLEEDVVATEPVPAAAAVEAAPAPEPVPEPAPAEEPPPAPEPAPASAPEAAPVPEVPPAPAPVAEDVVVVEAASAPTPAPSASPAAPAPAQPQVDASGDVAAPAPAASPAPVRVQAAAQPARTRPAVQAPSRRTPTKKWVTARAQVVPPARPEVEHEHTHERGATVWLNRALPDPTPAAARLSRPFARELARTAERHGADWATLLGVLRAQGERGARPATSLELDRLGARLRGDGWRGVLGLSGRTSFADRAEAFADLYRAVGLEALVTGLEAAKPRLVRELLADERVSIYPGGRTDLEAGRIDVRVVVLLRYLVERHGSVTVSSLTTGHRKYARPGVLSAHTFGHAVDIAAVGGTSIVGNSRPGGITEAAVRSILLLPAELQPKQVISLLGLGGPSFPLADHGDHIHVGF